MTVTVDALEKELIGKIHGVEEKLREALRNYLGAVEMDDFVQIDFWDDLVLHEFKRARRLLEEFPRQAAQLRWLKDLAERTGPAEIDDVLEHVNRKGEGR